MRHALQNKLIVERLRKGAAEYYSRDFSILVNWDGEETFDFIVQNNHTKEIMDKSTLTNAREFSKDIWDGVVDEMQRLKSKHLLNHGS
jgi:hypothetical protein